MARSSRSSRGVKRAIACLEWLYALLLRAYPATFRRDYGLRMTRVFRDSCRDTIQQRGFVSLIALCIHTFFDLFINACLEQWHSFKEGAYSMVTSKRSRNIPLALWLALVTTIIAFVVSLVASINLYLLEDASRLTETAYSLSPLLRFSYDGIYITALSAGVALCAIIGYALVRRELLVIIGLSIVALFVAFAGFGGLLIRHPETFLEFFVVFLALTLLSFLAGRTVATYATAHLGQRPAAILGACVSVGSVLLINVVALALHTIILNPVSHALYMQGQIAGTHLNFSLIAMVLTVLTMIACILSLARALYQSLRQPEGIR